MKTIEELGFGIADVPPVFLSTTFGTGNGSETNPNNTLFDFFMYRFAGRVTRYDDKNAFTHDLWLLASRFIAAKEASADVIDSAGRSTTSNENFTAPEGTPIFNGGAVPANSLGGTLTEQTGTPTIDTSFKTKMLRFSLDVIDDALDFFEPLFCGVILV